MSGYLAFSSVGFPHSYLGGELGYVVYLLISILFLWDFVQGLRAREELAGRLSIGISIGKLNRRMADEFGMKVEEIKRRGKI